MKKYLILGAVILGVGLLVNNLLGGFMALKPSIIEVDNYTIYGATFEGNYKSNDLTNLVGKMRVLQADLHEPSDVCIINFFNDSKETLGQLTNFVGIRTIRPSQDSLLLALDIKEVIATKAIRIEINVMPLVMPSPEKVKNIAYDYARKHQVELQNFSIEQYSKNGMLVVEFPVKDIQD